MAYTLNYTLINNGIEYEVSGYTGEPVEVVIPNEYEGLPVTSIGIKAFYNCSSLQSVVIGNNVTSINTAAFSTCNSLTNVIIGDSVVSIGHSAFYKCSSLMSIAIPDSVTSIDIGAFADCYNLASNIIIPNGVTSISDSTFHNCYDLKSVTIPDSVTSIGSFAFCNCRNLTSITIPEGVTSIGDCVFEGCWNLINVVIPNSVTSIGYGAFRRSGLISIVIPDSAISIQNFTFEECDSLTNVTIGNSVTSIGKYAFEDCTSLTSINIPDNVTSIGDFAFYRCDSLTSITIEGVASIEDYVFSNCSSLTSIIIPDSVTSIGYDVFEKCSNLTSITFLAKTPANISLETFQSISANVKFYCHSNALQSYQTATNWKVYADKFIADDLRLYFTMNATAQKNYFASKDWVLENDAVRKLELDTKYNKTGGTITGDVTIQGNLNVSGETTTLDTVTLQVKDNVIVANADGAELVENAGFAMKTSATSAYGIMYDPMGDGVKIGLGSFNDDGKFIYAENEAQFLATRADSIVDGNLPIWNDVTKRFEDSGEKLENFQKVADTEALIQAIAETLPAVVRVY